MSLLRHLVRATLAPEQAARPALPQQFANWGGEGGGADLEWGEEAAERPASPLAPRTEPAPDDAQATPEPRASAGAKAAMPSQRAPRLLPDDTEVQPLSPPHPPRASRQQAPAAVAEQAPPTAEPNVSRPRARRSAEPEAPPQMRTELRAPAPLPEPSVARPTQARPAQAKPDAPIAEPATSEPPRVIAPAPRPATADIAAPEAPTRPSASRDASQPARTAAKVPSIAATPAIAQPPAPEARRDLPRLERPRVTAPAARAAAPAPPQAHEPLAAPSVTPAPAAAPMLTVPQVIAAEPAAPPSLPDVHISIGRVEVRAAAAPPQRPASRTPAKAEPLSLDAYLSRRNGAAR